MKEEKNIPFRNYIILSIILILSIVLVIYFYMWYSTFENNKLNTPIMDKYLSVINYNEIDNYLVENKDAVIYVSILEDEKIRAFEKKLRITVNDYDINNTILYLDLTIEKDNLDKIMSKYNLNDLPSIIIFKNGKVDSVYNIKENNYEINSLISYLRDEGVIDD